MSDRKRQSSLPFLWLLSPVQTCFLVRNAFLEVVCLLLPSCGEDFVSQVHEALCREMSVEEHLLSQVGADAFHKARVQYICNEAISSFGHSSYKLVSQLLQTGDTNVLRWLIEKQIGDVPVPLGELLKEILQDMLCTQLTMDPSWRLRLLLEGFVHLHRVCPSLAVHHLPFTKTIQCVHSLLYLLESRKGGPQVCGHVLCTLSLLLVHSDLWKDLPIATRWLSALLACADPAISCEKLRLAAAEALHIAGGDLVRRALQTTAPGLTQLAVSAILCGVDLLQDEDRGVRDLVCRFAVSSLNDPAERSLHSDWAILCLLKLLRDHFWNCEETFHSLIFRLPPYDLHTALSSLHDRSMTLYEEDDPNVFADPNFLCNLLCPFIQDLLSLMSQEYSLCSVVLQWVESTEILVKEQIERWHSWVNEQGSVSLLSIRASACSRVHSAVLGLLVRSELLLKAHEMLLESGIQIAHLKVCPGSLTKELSQLKTVLELHGLSGFSNIVTNIRLCRKHFLSNGDSVP